MKEKKKISRKQPFISPSQWENKLIDLARSVERTTGYTVVDKKVYPKMELSEVIKVPISIGDTVLGGKFKNKRIVVKSIGKNDKGDITINNKPLLKYRILPKEEGLGPSDNDAVVASGSRVGESVARRAGGARARSDERRARAEAGDRAFLCLGIRFG